MPFVAGQPPYYAAPERRCRARSKQTGEQCKQLAVAGRETCHWHGGKSLRGRQHPAYKHGERSQRGRAQMRLVNRLGEALRRLERATTPEEIEAANKFAMIAMLDAPPRD